MRAVADSSSFVIHRGAQVGSGAGAEAMSGRRSVFSCEPENFPQIAISAQALNVDPQLVTEAVMRLAGGPVGSTEEIEYLAKELENES